MIIRTPDNNSVGATTIIRMAKMFPIYQAHPEGICWGCDKYCPVHSMCCCNGSDRAQHPVELFRDNWLEFGNENAKMVRAMRRLSI